MHYAFSMSPRPARGNYKGLGQAIREKCAAEGVGLEQMSIDLGLSRNSLSRWNNGTEPGPENYGVLMDLLGVTLEQLGALIVEDQLKKSGLPRP